MPLFLMDLKLSYLSLGNNQLCYSAAYNYWAPTTDFVATMACQNCVSPCQNGGTCSVNSVKMTCTCPPSWFGDTCSSANPNGCGPGLGYSSSGNCTSCLAGTFSLSGFSCVPCQTGTSSILLPLLPQAALPAALANIHILLGHKPAPPAVPTSARLSGASPHPLHPLLKRPST